MQHLVRATIANCEYLHCTLGDMNWSYIVMFIGMFYFSSKMHLSEVCCRIKNRTQSCNFLIHSKYNSFFFGRISSSISMDLKLIWEPNRKVPNLWEYKDRTEDEIISALALAISPQNLYILKSPSTNPTPTFLLLTNISVFVV